MWTRWQMAGLLAGLMPTFGCRFGEPDIGRPPPPSFGSAGASAESGGSGPSDTDTRGDPTDIVRFVALGDAGTGSMQQYAVASAMERVCADRGCDFALYLGDNFYSFGVTAVDDPQFQDKFELPYAGLDLRFYVALGNHDYGWVAKTWEQSRYQIDYTQHSDKWYLPREWYTVRVGPVQLYAIDTTRLMYEGRAFVQENWFHAMHQASDARWHVVFGHHPYVSNGSHGNAGHYDGIDPPHDEARGVPVQRFFERLACGRADLYLAGHDHTRQWLETQCGTEFIVAGAGSQTTSLVHRDFNPVLYEDDAEVGFIWIEIEGDELTGVFYDAAGNVDFEHSVVKDR